MSDKYLTMLNNSCAEVDGIAAPSGFVGPDVLDAIRAHNLCETVFADDLNCFHDFDGSVGDAYIFEQM